MAELIGLPRSEEERELDPMIKKLNYATYGIATKYGIGSARLTGSTSMHGDVKDKKADQGKDLASTPFADNESDHEHLLSLGLTDDQAGCIVGNMPQRTHNIQPHVLRTTVG